MNHTTSTVAVPGGGVLAVDRAGDGPPVVLLHSGLTDRRAWRPVAAGLVSTHTVHSIDFRGSGGSDAARSFYSLHQDVLTVLDRFGLDRATLVGESLGGRAAIDVALTSPDRVEALVLVSPGASGMTFADPFIVDRHAAIAAAASAGDLDGVVESLLQAWFDGPHRHPVDVDADQRRHVAAMIRENLPKRAAAAAEPTELDAVERLDELTTPTSVLVGSLDSDDITTLAERIATRAPSATLTVVDGVGHLISVERPDVVVAAVANVRDLGRRVEAPAVSGQERPR
jgi:pimeloyl-ACP methyl ester carboxylesterase